PVFCRVAIRLDRLVLVALLVCGETEPEDCPGTPLRLRNDGLFVESEGRIRRCNRKGSEGCRHNAPPVSRNFTHRRQALPRRGTRRLPSPRKGYRETFGAPRLWREVGIFILAPGGDGGCRQTVAESTQAALPHRD